MPSESPPDRAIGHILGVHHVQITIPAGREDMARAFYCAFLGLREIEKPDNLKPRGGFWLEAGDRQVHVGVDEGAVDRRATKAHIAYQVSGLTLWRERLRSRGVEILERAPIPGYDRFEFRDPFGNRVEFLEAVVAISPRNGIPKGQDVSDR
jgi:catechol 2,3-dioxygenase-like lactoylglutathione lyase family enzyme